MLSFADIEAARRRIKESVKETPCKSAAALSERTRATVSLKLENLQHTGSFKARGALNRLLTLPPDVKTKGVVAASAGNHAQGVAYFAQKLGIPSIIVMPEGTPLIKVTRTNEYGADTRLVGANYDEAFDHARAICAENGSYYVHGYDDDAVMAGQGTIGLELIEQNPYAEVVIVPVGGGGLIAGIASAMKKAKPTIRMIGVECTGLPSMAASVKAGHVVDLPPIATIAEGIAVRKVGEKCLEICRKLVDDWVTVDDNEISRAILHLLEREKTVAEGAGAAAVAALLAGRVKDIEDRNVVAVVCGGNIDVTVLSRIIERGLVESGRLCRLSLHIQDSPGALADMLQTVGQSRGNIIEVHHERAFSGGRFGSVFVKLVVETRGHPHIADLIKALEHRGFSIERSDGRGANAAEPPLGSN